MPVPVSPRVPPGRLSSSPDSSASQLVLSVLNEASCRVAVKPGFSFEGVRRRGNLHADGWHDMHVHARVRGDGQSGWTPSRSGA
ncbi:hypothetical protein [Streptomyces atroolivaceus]|uniref:hypothetical protein n=1 Tax=Streptomyces atroolivaceus TaxID=66869 RepID=UPI003F4D7176